jgi:DNA-binding NtrC family response regulator
MVTFRILVVDDEVDFLETIVNRLQKRKLEVVGVASGEEALQSMKEQLFDVILLTGHASVETSIEGMKLGAFDYLLKPVKFEDLLEKMAEAFRKKSTHDKKIRDAKIKELLRFPGRVFDQDKEKP